jgi:phenylacetate-CoA ligase
MRNHPDDHRLHQDYRKENLIASTSSGSTGEALIVYYDYKSFNKFVFAGLRLYNMVFPYFPWHKQTYVYTSPYPFDSLFGLYPLNFISTLTPIPDILKQLRKKKPDLLVCYPSHLTALLDQMTEEDFKLIRPTAINVNSEMSCPVERKLLSEKLTRIASQCREYNYHIFDDINYLEIVDDNNNLLPEGHVGNIVGSNLHNRAMPLLRYMQGDRGAIRSKPCKCGRTFRTLEKLEGRKNDSFILPDGKKLSSGFLLDLTYGILLDCEGSVSAFCLIQETPELWFLEIVPGQHWCESLAQKILQKFLRDLNQPRVQLTLKKVTAVTHTLSGKINPIVSHVQH